MASRKKKLWSSFHARSSFHVCKEEKVMDFSVFQQKWTTHVMLAEFNISPSTPFIDRRGIITFVTPEKDICEFDEKEKRIVVASQKYENEEMYLRWCTYCYHAPTNQIFIFDASGNLFIYNASTKQWKIRELNVRIGDYACCVCLRDSTCELLVFGYIREETGDMSITLPEDVTSILVSYFGDRDRIHILGGASWGGAVMGGDNTHHLIYDIESETLDKSGLELEEAYQSASITVDAQRNTIYFIGGMDSGYKPSSSMHEIAVTANGSKSKHVHKMPKANTFVGCIFYSPYILIFAGVSGYSRSNDIYSFHIHTHEWMKLPIYTPFKGPCHAILARDRKRVHLFETRGWRSWCYSIALPDLLPENSDKQSKQT